MRIELLFYDSDLSFAFESMDMKLFWISAVKRAHSEWTSLL